KESTITMGRYVSAGDRFESFSPGYQAVKDQRKVPRYDLPMLSAGLTPDNRTVVLQTAPRALALNYAIKLPDAETRNCDSSRAEWPKHSAIDLLSDLTGVEAVGQPATKGVESWSGWLPHFDLAVARAFSEPSQEHSHLFELLTRPGTLVLRGQLDLWH